MTKRIGILATTLVLSLVIMTGLAGAQTISFADAAALLARDCGPDIEKYCKGLNLGNNAIRNCLEGHQSNVSPTCTATASAVATSIERRLAAQASVMKICSGHAKTLCKGVVGEANILRCLVRTERLDGAKCNQAITDSGWR